VFRKISIELLKFEAGRSILSIFLLNRINTHVGCISSKREVKVMRARFGSALRGCCLAVLALAAVGLRQSTLSLHLRSGCACDRATSHALKAADVDAVVGADPSVVRRLGGYERLLSRKAPNSDSLSLSHGAAYELDGAVSDEDLVKAAAACLKR
jgi:hypothetical protein